MNEIRKTMPNSRLINKYKKSQFKRYSESVLCSKFQTHLNHKNFEESQKISPDQTIHFFVRENRNFLFFNNSKSIISRLEFEDLAFQKETSFIYESQTLSIDFTKIKNIFNFNKFTFFISENALYATAYTVFHFFHRKVRRQAFINLSKYIFTGCENLIDDFKGNLDKILPKNFEFLFFNNKLIIFRVGLVLVLKRIKIENRENSQINSHFIRPTKKQRSDLVIQLSLEGIFNRFIGIECDIASGKMYLYNAVGNIYLLKKNKQTFGLIHIKKLLFEKLVRIYFFQNQVYLLDIYGRIQITNLYTQKTILSTDGNDLDLVLDVKNQKVDFDVSENETLEGENERIFSKKFEMMKKSILFEKKNDGVEKQNQFGNKTVLTMKEKFDQRKTKNQLKLLFDQKHNSLTNFFAKENITIKKIFNPHLFNFSRKTVCLNRESSNSQVKLGINSNIDARLYRDHSTILPHMKSSVSKVIEDNILQDNNKEENSDQNTTPHLNIDSISFKGEAIIHLYITIFRVEIYLLTNIGNVYKLLRSPTGYHCTKIDLQGVKVFNIQIVDSIIYFLGVSKGEGTFKKPDYLPERQFGKIKRNKKKYSHGFNISEK